LFRVDGVCARDKPVLLFVPLKETAFP
jgi:hypothetical protein